MYFAQNLMKIMTENRLTRYALAKELHCHPSTITYWLEGSSSPNRKYKLLIAEKFGYTVESLDAPELIDRKLPAATETDAPGRDELARVFQKGYELGKAVTGQGKVANYIPALAKADPHSFGICMLDGRGQCLSFGDAEKRFSIQSICKLIILAVSLKTQGFDGTFSHVMMEPSGDAFNSILKLDIRSNLPFNPLINAGAIQLVSTLVEDYSYEELEAFARELCMDEEICLNEEVYRSESRSGDRNRAIAYLLKSKGVLQGDAEKTLDLYFRLCSLSVNARSLAALGLVISNGGLNPLTCARLIEAKHVRTIKSLMFTCGLYDFSGQFGVKVGVPGKSGVGGGLLCAARGPMGIGLYGPALDEFGNSVAAVRAMEYLSEELGLHVFDYEGRPGAGLG